MFACETKNSLVLPGVFSSLKPPICGEVRYRCLQFHLSFEMRRRFTSPVHVVILESANCVTTPGRFLFVLLAVGPNNGGRAHLPHEDPMCEGDNKERTR